MSRRISPDCTTKGVNLIEAMSDITVKPTWRGFSRNAYRDASRASRLSTGPASFKEQRSRTRRRSHCMPRRLHIRELEPQDSHVRGTE